MARYVTFKEIAAAIDGMPIDIRENELVRHSYRARSPLKLIRRAGGTSAAQWRADDIQTWFARRYRNAPELVEQFILNINLPDAAPKKPKKVQGS